MEEVQKTEATTESATPTEKPLRIPYKSNSLLAEIFRTVGVINTGYHAVNTVYRAVNVGTGGITPKMVGSSVAKTGISAIVTFGGAKGIEILMNIPRKQAEKRKPADPTCM